MTHGWHWIAALALVSGAAQAQDNEQEELTLDAVFGSPSLSGSMPRSLQLSPDGRYATLLKPRVDDRQRYDLWAIDTSTGEERMLVDSEALGGREISEEEKMRRERMRLAGTRGIVSYDWGPDGKALLVPIDGDLWLAPLEGAPRQLTDTEAGELDAKLSETGRYASFVRGGDLYVVETATGAEHRVTDGASDTITWGSAEFVAQEELDRSSGHWWSPDDSRLAVARVDESGVEVVQRLAIGAEGSSLIAQRYPRAGTDNALVDLYVMRPDGSERVKVDLGDNPDVYLARVYWSADGQALWVGRLSRDQKRLDLLEVDPATGASQVLLSETSDTFVNLASSGFGQGGEAGLRSLKGGGFLWLSERDGYMHLYRWQDGDLTQLTHGDWVVSGLAGVDEANGLAYVTGNRETPLERHIYSVRLDGTGEPERLTESGYWNSGALDRTGTRLIIQRQSPVQPPQVYLADNTGERLAWIEQNAIGPGHPFAPYADLLREPDYGTLTASDGQVLHWEAMKPEGEGPFPVILEVYGGPHAQRVARYWTSPLDRWWVEQGYAIFRLDNRGSGNRGRAFEEPLYQAFGTVEVEDQLAGLDWLKQQDWADADRIVGEGWSYGGYMTLKLLEAAPGAFAGGISGAPVTQWGLYDTAYTERYLGDPREVPEVYEAADVLPRAGNIADPLLVIHGMSDDNVVFDNAVRLLAALQQARVPFDTAVYPGQAHGFQGKDILIHRTLAMQAFLDRVTAAD
ncbi:DPP IV N-terminal domain-containing protein [Aurantiacibacter flavus]|uniref:S9 family peptidase n=1 Tax=Aurantiacibacter flavus TaxID=3145232 RepID=UPI003D1F941E